MEDQAEVPRETKSPMDNVILDERAYVDESSWHMVKVRIWWEKRVYDRLFQGKDDSYSVSPAEFLLALGIKLPEMVTVLRFGQYKNGGDVVYYGYKDLG